MNKMKLVSMYEDYGNPDMWDKNSSVKCVCDRKIKENVREGKQVAMLIEPRSILPDTYEYILDHYQEYEYVFTHDSMLLRTLSNAKPILWGGVWHREEKPKKDKLICMICSDKEYCLLHQDRKMIARKYKDKIDVYGTIDGGAYVSDNVHKDYMYEVVIENYIDDIWFSEKICNCFATKTIPIYYGARDIGKYFNTKGMIICESISELEEKLDYYLENPDLLEFLYKKNEEALDENYELSKQYEKFDDWLYRTYEKEINKLFDK